MGTSVESVVMFKDSQGAESSGTLVHLTPSLAVFEVYGPRPPVHPREILKGVRILRSGQPVYMGTIEVSGIAPNGPGAIVSANLVDPWQTVERSPAAERFNAEARAFMAQWENHGPLLPDYQVAVGNARDFLLRVSRWVASLDVGADAPFGEPLQREMVTALDGVLTPKLRELFAAFEAAAAKVPADKAAQHIALARRELHPLLMCSPFLHRTFTKPLGYAGDYEMVNMILRDRFEGPTTYARLINSWILQAEAGQAHRNRIDMLERYLADEAARVRGAAPRAKIINIGCGPAEEVCRFLLGNPQSANCDLTLLDFNRETIEYASQKIEQAMSESGRRPKVTWLQKSVTDLVKERPGRVNGNGNGNGKRHGNGNGNGNGHGNGNGNGNGNVAHAEYDFVYCAGLFDYLSDRVCARLIELFMSQLAPGGLLVTTNVHPSNPVRYFMEHLLDWNLIMRDEAAMLALAPAETGVKVLTEPTGVNVFLEIRRPGQ